MNQHNTIMSVDDSNGPSSEGSIQKQLNGAHGPTRTPSGFVVIYFGKRIVTLYSHDAGFAAIDID